MRIEGAFFDAHKTAGCSFFATGKHARQVEIR
jgi:hypothetical protein